MKGDVMKSIEFKFDQKEDESLFDDLISSLKEWGKDPATVPIYFSMEEGKRIRKIKDYCFYIDNKLISPDDVKDRLRFWLNVLIKLDIARYIEKPHELIVYSDNSRFIGGSDEEWNLFPFLLAMQYTVELNKLFKIGLDMNYDRVEKEMTPIKGRINFIKEPFARAKCKISTPQVLFERSYNTDENRLLKTAVNVLLKNPYIHNESQLYVSLKLYQKMFDELGVEDIELSYVNWIDVYSSIPYYAQPVILAKNIIKSIGFYGGHGRAVSFAVKEYMLFEALMSSIVKDVAESKGLDVETQKKSKIELKKRNGNKPVRYIPDILIKDENEKKLIIMDLKNKNLTDNESKSSILNQDLYQMISYWLFHKINNEYKDYDIFVHLVYGIDEDENMLHEDNEYNTLNVRYELPLDPWLRKLDEDACHKITLIVSQIYLPYKEDIDDIKKQLKHQVRKMLNHTGK